MTTEKFFNENDHKFLPLFEKDHEGTGIYYFKHMVSDEEVIRLTKEGETPPQLIYGTTGINSGFAVYTGAHFVWFKAETPEEALEFAQKITAFDEI